MRLILIRHALPERVETATDAPDPPLSSIGLRQVDALVETLAGERIDAVWASPLARARQTAQPLADARGLPVQVHDGLREFDFGDGLYIPAEDTEHPAVRAIAARMDDQEGNVDLLDFQRVVVAAIGDIIAVTAPDATAAVSCHGGVINAYAAAVLRVPDVFFGKISYTGTSWFTVSRSGRVRLVTLNEHAHVRALDPTRG
ncbi:MAG: histidine phosphatase family protein [Jatrophihabitans sp.]